MSPIHGAGIGCCGRVNHVVDRIQRERYVVGHPENSIAAANDGGWRQTISQPDPGRKVVPLKRKVVRLSLRYQVDIAFDGWITCRKKLVQITRRVGDEIGEPVKTFEPRSLQLITKSQTE